MEQLSVCVYKHLGSGHGVTDGWVGCVC